MRKKDKLVRGAGINDADYPVSKHDVINGKRVQIWVCPFYRHWSDLIQRCFSAKTKARQSCYKSATICDEWVRFSGFREWMERQDWDGKDLDKDIISPGNKHYSPENCAFVPRSLNRFLTDRHALRGKWPIGVHWASRDRGFYAQINNPFTGRREFLGSFDCPEDAHEAWRQRKHDLACIYADQQSDERIALALRSRYADRYRLIEEWRTEQANNRQESKRYGN